MPPAAPLARRAGALTSTMKRCGALCAALAVAAAIVRAGTDSPTTHDELLPLVTYSLSARSFAARALEASPELLELRLPLAALPVAMPSVVPAEGGMLHASSSASYFLRAWSALSAAASALGGRFPIAA
jgi:hypothetical protein